ncbi:hypothetical protein M9458_055822, partial [Cirrhinus mrigala]
MVLALVRIVTGPDLAWYWTRSGFVLERNGYGTVPDPALIWAKSPYRSPHLVRSWPSSGPDAEKRIRAGIGPLCQRRQARVRCADLAQNFQWVWARSSSFQPGPDGPQLFYDPR